MKHTETEVGVADKWPVELYNTSWTCKCS